MAGEQQQESQISVGNDDPKRSRDDENDVNKGKEETINDEALVSAEKRLREDLESLQRDLDAYNHELETTEAELMLVRERKKPILEARAALRAYGVDRLKLNLL